MSRKRKAKLMLYIVESGAMKDYYNSATNDILDGMVVNDASEPSGKGAVIVDGHVDNDGYVNNDEDDGGGGASRGHFG